MEDTLWVNKSAVEVALFVVLILVLMEDTLWEKVFEFHTEPTQVLILVLMEDTLWGDLKMLKEAEYES